MIDRDTTRLFMALLLSCGFFVAIWHLWFKKELGSALQAPIDGNNAQTVPVEKLTSGRDDIHLNTDVRFSCTLMPDTKNGGQVWTIRYHRNDGKTQEWLRMVRSMGNGWDTQKRCSEISQRLESYLPDGLLGFTYRGDKNTPHQYVLCAKLERRTDCPLVLTLMSDDNPEKEVQEVASALILKNSASYQQEQNLNKNSEQKNYVFINLTKFL